MISPLLLWFAAASAAVALPMPAALQSDWQGRDIPYADDAPTVVYFDDVYVRLDLPRVEALAAAMRSAREELRSFVPIDAPYDSSGRRHIWSRAASPGNLRSVLRAANGGRPVNVVVVFQFVDAGGMAPVTLTVPQRERLFSMPDDASEPTSRTDPISLGTPLVEWGVPIVAHAGRVCRFHVTPTVMVVAPGAPISLAASPEETAGCGPGPADARASWVSSAKHLLDLSASAIPRVNASAQP